MNNRGRINAALTSIRHTWEYREADKCPATVITALSENLPHIAVCSWEERISWGGVYINGRSVDTDRSLTVPCRLEYFEPKFDLAQVSSQYPAFRAEWVVYEDADLLVVFKPTGLPSLPVREQKFFNMRNYLCAHTGCAVHLPSRLDTATSGLMAVSRSDRLHGRLQKLFENRQVMKTYILEALGVPDWIERTVDNAIARDQTHAVLRKTVSEGGKPARTVFRFLSQSCATDNPASLLLARPLSGRTHQIRVHAQSIGHPLIGDNFYGGPPADTLHLLSYRLQIRHPLSGQDLDIRVPDHFLPEWLDASRLQIAPL